MMIRTLVSCVALLIVGTEAGSGSCNFQCPQNSERKPNRNCYNNVKDCECNPGYVIRYTGNSQGYCERYDGSSGGGGYQCPSNSHRIPGRRNYDNFLDCECDDNYRRHMTSQYEGFCERWDNGACPNSYRCPQHSHPRERRQCYNGFSDCTCDSGYRPVWYNNGWDGRCDPDSHCNSYQCAPNSDRKPNRQCYDTQDDCYCLSGYYLSSDGQRCEPQFTAFSQSELDVKPRDSEIPAFDEETTILFDDEFQEDDEAPPAPKFPVAAVAGAAAGSALMIAAVVGAVVLKKRAGAHRGEFSASNPSFVVAPAAGAAPETA